MTALRLFRTHWRNPENGWRMGVAIIAAFPAVYILSLAACAAVRASGG